MTHEQLFHLWKCQSVYQHGSGQEKVHRRALLGGPFGRHDEGTPDPLTASSWECTALVIHGEKGGRGKFSQFFLQFLDKRTRWEHLVCTWGWKEIARHSEVCAIGEKNRTSVKVFFPSCPDAKHHDW